MKKRDVGLMIAIFGLILVMVSLITIFNVENAIYTSTTGKAFQTDYCTSDCSGKACGADDGCGSPCQTGSCSTGQTCSSGTCVDIDTCTANCAGKECGSDGCDGSCGSCGAGKTCSSGTCVNVNICIPNCAGKVCGSDGCTGSCGTCTTGLICIGGGCIISEFECGDNIDNDADQLIDDKDPGCWSDLFDSSTYDVMRNDEGAATSQCQDGLDNELDGLIDENDPECFLNGNYDLTINNEGEGALFNSSVEWYSKKSLFGTLKFGVILWIILGCLLVAIGGSVYYFIFKSKKKKKKRAGKKNKRARSTLFWTD